MHRLNRLEKFDEVVSVTGPAIARAEAQLPDTAMDKGVLHVGRAMALTGLERYAEAEPHFLRAHEIFERVTGPDSMATQKSIEFLADMYDRWGRPDEAAAARARLPAG